MEQNQNLLTAYSFLAALTENQSDLFNTVYVPVCKRALSLYSAQKKTHGAISDLQDIILEEFGIKVPSSFIKRLLRSVEKQMSNKEKGQSGFALFENGQHFSIGRYAYTDLEYKLRKSQRESNAIQSAFEDFLNEEQIPINDIPPFADFLRKNNKRIASFLSGNHDVSGNSLDNSYYHHAEFLKYIESSSHQLFEIVESLYLGSVVASFVEADFDFEPKFTEGEIFYLDTPFLLRVLELQSEENCKAAIELVELIRTTGGQLKVLSITVDELQGLLEKAIQLYDSKNPTSTINEACQRNNFNKTHLIKLSGDLEKHLVQNLRFAIEQVSNSQKEKYVKSVDLKLLKEKRFRAGTAEHDVMAYLFVREKRNGVVQSFQKAKIWFLTTNMGLLTFNRETMPYQGISEIVLPDALTSLLWLRNPAQLSSTVKKAGLSQLLSVTLSEEIVSKELIIDFQTSISSINGITKDDYKTLLNSVAYESARRIEKFVEKSINEPQAAALEAQRIIEKERRRRSNEQQRLKEATVTIKKEQDDKNELTSRLVKIEADLLEFSNANQELRASRESNQTTIEKLSQQIEQHRKYQRNWIRFVLIFFLICSLGFIGWLFRNQLSVWVNWLWQGILAIGAFWSFGSFIINLFKAFKSK